MNRSTKEPMTNYCCHAKAKWLDRSINNQGANGQPLLPRQGKMVEQVQLEKKKEI